MDSRILDTLRLAPSIDLYELSIVIEKMLADPTRIFEVSRHLHLGAQVNYFNHKTNQLHLGRVMQLLPTALVVLDEGLGGTWKLPYAAVVPLALKPQHSAPPTAPIPTLTDFKLGDTVAFTDKHLRERVGKITRINSKTCSVDCEDASQWRVSPRMLRKLIDL